MLKYWDILALAKTAKTDHILDVFSGQGVQIELIPLHGVRCLETQVYNAYMGHFETKKFQLFWHCTPLEGNCKNYSGEKNSSPMDLITR